MSAPRQVVGRVDGDRVVLYARHPAADTNGETILGSGRKGADGVDRPIALDLDLGRVYELRPEDVRVRLSVAEAQGLVDELQLRIREATP